MNAAYDVLERYSRRSLWTLLFLLIAIGAGAALSLAYPAVSRLSMLIPLMFVIAAAALRSSAKGADVNPSSPGMKAILNDELRQASMHRAFRNAFLAVLIAQPLLAFLPELVAIDRPAPLMAVVTIWIGMIVMVASVLYHDR
jgi:hypothetical protein